ncbi:hypothetical protein MAR_036078 [Mya arenaria]|uniref:Uncharacterized protein n=1 Tax=Mya arenaria TaxID=6604 RepID=A0ABY7ELY0_MYAAR|nr:hypothetical protein MAR_036078 [Mya arenaria]
MKPQIGNLKDSEGQVWNGVKETKTGSRALLVVGACVFLALMTAAILGSVYLGYSLHPLGSVGKQQTYTADFYQDGHHVVKETLGFAVYKMDHLPGCYLTTFNMSEKDNYSSNSQNQVSIEVKQTLKQRYSVTDITVNRAVLGPQAASMCAGRDLYMLRQQTDSTNDVALVKRAAAADHVIIICCRCGDCVVIIVREQ